MGELRIYRSIEGFWVSSKQSPLRSSLVQKMFISYHVNSRIRLHRVITSVSYVTRFIFEPETKTKNLHSYWSFLEKIKATDEIVTFQPGWSSYPILRNLNQHHKNKFLEGTFNRGVKWKLLSRFQLGQLRAKSYTCHESWASGRGGSYYNFKHAYQPVIILDNGSWRW